MSQSPQPPEGERQSLTVTNLFDLAEGSDWKVNVSNENPLDRDYRLQQDSYDAQHRRWRTTILFIFVLTGVAIAMSNPPLLPGRLSGVCKPENRFISARIS